MSLPATVRREPTDAELNAYRAQTDRLLKLSDFVTRMPPAFGESVGEGRELADELVPLALLKARNAAIQDAFEAVAEIARNS